ncbi:MAG: cyclodeaminase/cyclohydrolase family protein [Halobacteriales archaeon]
MSFADMTVREFVEELSGDSATPGGGSAAAVAGAMGAALGEMVCNLTIGKEDFEDVEADMEAAREALEDSRERLFELADEDAEAFDELMAAYRTPEDEGKAEAIEEASKTAAEVPVETAEECLIVIEEAVDVAAKGNPNAVTDAGTAALLAHAALESALYNVEINLGSIDDEAFREAMREETDRLVEEADAALAEVQDAVDANL